MPKWRFDHRLNSKVCSLTTMKSYYPKKGRAHSPKIIPLMTKSQENGYESLLGSNLNLFSLKLDKQMEGLVWFGYWVTEKNSTSPLLTVSEDQPTSRSRTAFTGINMMSDLSWQLHDSVKHLEAKYLENKTLWFLVSLEGQMGPEKKKSIHHSNGCRSPHVFCHVGPKLKWALMPFAWFYLVTAELHLPLSLLFRGGRAARNTLVNPNP